MKTLTQFINIENTNIENVNEARMGIEGFNRSNNPVDCDIISLGETEVGVPGLIIGKPFKYSPNKPTKEEKDAYQAIRFMKINIGNDYEDWIDDYLMDSDNKEPYLCYFKPVMDNQAHCYVFGDGGVYVVVE